jgi:CRISPR system Cascade subunit CasE
MILSRLVLNLRSRDVARDLADCQQLHRTLLNAFPRTAATPRHEFALLFRVEYPPGRDPFVLVQSREAPNFTHVADGYLGRPVESKDLSEVFASLRAGMKLRFRLRANPTRKIDTRSAADGTRRNGRRVDLRSHQDRLGWLFRKAPDAGFKLVSVKCSPDVMNVRLVPQVRLIGFRAGAGGVRRRLTFGSVLFEGTLEVLVPEKFRAALETGIGTAKAYGFGLLSIGPVDA